MKIIKALNIVYDYITRDDETEKEITNRAIDDVYAFANIVRST